MRGRTLGSTWLRAMRVVGSLGALGGVVGYSFFTHDSASIQVSASPTRSLLDVLFVVWWLAPSGVYAWRVRTAPGSFVGVAVPIVTFGLIRWLHIEPGSMIGVALLFYPILLYGLVA